MVIPANSILITGASSGYGAALAEVYARPGVALWLGGRDEARLAAVASLCRARGAEVTARRLDVTARAAMAQWIEECHRGRPLDLVVANAGISAGTGGIPKDGGVEAPHQAQRIFAVNVDGVFNTVEPAIPLMRGREPRPGVAAHAARGQIAIVSSLAGFRGFPGAPAYSASKAAVKAWGEALAPLLAREGIAVSVICPGFVVTPMTARNDFHMPFLMTADAAARRTRRGLDRARRRIAFPWPTYAAAWLLGALPPALGDRLLRGSPGKAPFNERL
ncbi:MAG TPA: SDR family NAD(P)-dependent oxidoreductase [Alphaproteobacteria bacterium]|nr:SDR family NAD(P)-dependent oxidoreductase [Alphaproteobacteria bacterium]